MRAILLFVVQFDNPAKIKPIQMAFKAVLFVLFLVAFKHIRAFPIAPQEGEAQKLSNWRTVGQSLNLELALQISQHVLPIPIVQSYTITSFAWFVDNLSHVYVQLGIVFPVPVVCVIAKHILSAVIDNRQQKLAVSWAASYLTLRWLTPLRDNIGAGIYWKTKTGYYVSK